MTSKKGYRDQAAEVRSAARDQLAQLRQERLANRRSVAGQRGDDQVIVPMQQASDDVLEVPQAEYSQFQEAPEFHKPDEVPGGETSEAVDIDLDDTNTPRVGLSTDPITENCGDTPDIREPVFASGTQEDWTTPSDESAWEGDLHLLPGAGNALIWMLNQSGIDSLADLSVADPRQLSDQLGAVGQILNMQTWINFAKEKNKAPIR